MGRIRGRELMKPVVMLAICVGASVGVHGCGAQKYSASPPHRTFSLLFRRRQRKR